MNYEIQKLVDNDIKTTLSVMPSIAWQKCANMH